MSFILKQQLLSVLYWLKSVCGHESTRGQVENSATGKPVEDKKRPRTETDPSLLNGNGNKASGCTGLHKMSAVGFVGSRSSWAKESRGTMEQQVGCLRRCQDMTHSSPDCNYWIPERGNTFECVWPIDVAPLRRKHVETPGQRTHW